MSLGLRRDLYNGASGLGFMNSLGNVHEASYLRFWVLGCSPWISEFEARHSRYGVLGLGALGLDVVVISGLNNWNRVLGYIILEL